MTEPQPPRSRRRAVAGGAAVVGVLVVLTALLLVAVWPGDGDAADDLEAVVGEGEITPASASVDEFAEVVRVVGRGDIPDADKRRVAAGLGLYLDEIGASVRRQAEGWTGSGETREDFARPDMVDVFAELGHDEAAAQQVADGVVAWLLRLVEPFLDDSDLEPGEVGDTFEPPALLVGSVADGFDAAGSSPVDGNDFERIVVGQFREDLAITVAERNGWPRPVAGEYGVTLTRAFPGVDLVGRLDLATSDARHEDPDAPWQMIGSVVDW